MTRRPGPRRSARPATLASPSTQKSFCASSTASAAAKSSVGNATTLSARTSAQGLGQRDDDALGAADVAEAIAVLVLRHLANELSAVAAQAAEYLVKVIHGKHE